MVPSQTSNLLNLPSDLLLPILSHLPSPIAFLTTCRTTYLLSKDPYVRATWIRSQVPSTPGVPSAILAFYVGVRHRILNAAVVNVLDNMESRVSGRTAQPPAHWDGWRMLSLMLALRGDAEILKLAIEEGLIKHWRTFIQSADGCGNKAVVAVALEHLISTSNLNDPILQHYALLHTVKSNSSALFQKTLTLIPETSPTWSTIPPTLFTIASPKLLVPLSAFLKQHPLIASTLVLAAKHQILSDISAFITLEYLSSTGAVDLRRTQKEAGKMLLRGAALEGDVTVVDRLVKLGAVVDDGCVKNAKVGGSRKCVKVLARAVRV
ncbi:hypothetical protein HDV00_008580 [Rhizophlyctis rosea]|nr:hypothetical protein HDV00_008580 [Rhizophlyctis rosea]